MSVETALRDLKLVLELRTGFENDFGCLKLVLRL